jgi:hypothetical protein
MLMLACTLTGTVRSPHCARLDIPVALTKLHDCQHDIVAFSHLHLHRVQVVELFRALLSEGLDADAASYTILMRAYQSLGSMSLAQDTFATAEAAGKANVVAHNLLVDILVATGDLERAASIVRDLSDAASTHSGPRAQALLPAFDTLARGYFKERRCEDAVALLRKFNSLGGLPDEPFFDTVLRNCVLCGEVRCCSSFEV